MAQDNQEQEAKFYISDRAALEAKLLALGAALTHARVFESNLRFDLPDGSLSARRQVLRLRMDERVRLTLKGPQEEGAEVSSRQEIEFEVSSFNNARALLEALGYRLIVMYEKYRTTYTLGGCEVTVDEMPYGDFAEIEGPGADAIHAVAGRLGLAWETRSAESYLMLFSRLTAAGLNARNLRFAEVTQKYPPEAFGLRAADAASGG
jgi:adenylate cyclase, class 2